jgi:hypothetical protein
VALDGDHDGLGRPRSAGKTSTHFGEIVNAGALSAATRETSGFALGSSTKACITFCAQSDFGSAPILREAIGGLRKTRHRGRDLVEWFFVLTAAGRQKFRDADQIVCGGGEDKNHSTKSRPRCRVFRKPPIVLIQPKGSSIRFRLIMLMA